MDSDANSGASRATNNIGVFAVVGLMLWMAVVQHSFVRDALPMLRAVPQIDAISERLAVAVEVFADAQKQVSGTVEARIDALELAVERLQDRCPCGRSTDAGH